jgi:hypothetical protein
MIKVPNKFVLLSAIAAATLVIPGTLGPLAFEEAYADHRGNSQDNEQSANAIQNAQGVVVAQVAVPANVNVQVTDVNACIIVSDCD